MLDVAPSSSIRPRMRSAFRPCPQDDGYVAQDGLNSGSAISRHAVVHSRAAHDREPCTSTTCIFVINPPLNRLGRCSRSWLGGAQTDFHSYISLLPLWVVNGPSLC